MARKYLTDLDPNGKLNLDSRDSGTLSFRVALEAAALLAPDDGAKEGDRRSVGHGPSQSEILARRSD